MYSFLFEQVGKHHNLENKSQKKDMKTAKKRKKKKTTCYSKSALFPPISTNFYQNIPYIFVSLWQIGNVAQTFFWRERISLLKTTKQGLLFHSYWWLKNSPHHIHTFSSTKVMRGNKIIYKMIMPDSVTTFPGWNYQKWTTEWKKNGYLTPWEWKS